LNKVDPDTKSNNNTSIK